MWALPVDTRPQRAVQTSTELQPVPAGALETPQSPAPSLRTGVTCLQAALAPGLAATSETGTGGGFALAQNRLGLSESARRPGATRQGLECCSRSCLSTRPWSPWQHPVLEARAAAAMDLRRPKLDLARSAWGWGEVHVRVSSRGW